MAGHGTLSKSSILTRAATGFNPSLCAARSRSAIELSPLSRDATSSVSASIVVVMLFHLATTNQQFNPQAR